MSRWIAFLFGVAAYLFGLGSLVLFFLFVGGWDFMPWDINAEPSGPIGFALATNLALIILFGVQHSVMARTAFKNVWNTIIPQPIERSFYCLASGVVLYLICFSWQPIGGTVWHIDNQFIQFLLIAIQIGGWVVAVSASFMINHFELFGLQQTYYHLVERPEPKPTFTVKYLYRFVRHPLQMGLLIGLWSTPHMSMSHLMLSTCMTVYIFVGLYHEERGLVTLLGKDYEDYRRRVPMILPIPRR